MQIIAGLIYNEFIILNFCGLQKYTKLFLQKEAIDDIQQTDIININDDNDLDSEGENPKQFELTIINESSENNNNRELNYNAIND